MSSGFLVRFVVTAVALLLSLPGVAQSADFDVLIDTDRSAATGCSVMPAGGTALDGFEHRIRARVNLATFQVDALERAACAGGSFGAPVPVGGFSTPYPLALNAGVAGADAVELAVARAALGATNLSRLRLAFVTDNGTGSDVLASVDGAGGGPIVLGLPVQIPVLSIWGLGVLVFILLGLAWLAHRRMGRVGAVMAVMLVTTAAWAMTFALDGNLSDWGGRAPNATDPGGDATDGSAAIDLVAGFVVLDGDDLFFRMDVSDAENQAPTAVDDAYSIDEDTPLNVAAPGVLANDSDAELDPITAVLDTGPANAQAFTLNPDGSFDYTPSADFNGGDSFTYLANDGQADSAPATVTITVNAINDPPVAVDDVATTNEDTQVDIDVLANDSDVDGNLDPATVTVTSGPANGTTSVNPATGVITYTKSGDFNGSDGFSYEVCDDGAPLPALCATATVSINVDPVNDAPTFTASNPPVVNEDAGPQTVNAWVTAFDPGPGEGGQSVLGYIVGNLSNPGLFSAGPGVDAAGNLSYTPAPDAFGSSTFDVAVQDDGGTANGGTDTSPTQTFTITVNPVDDPPVAVGDSAAVAEDDPATTIDVLANDTDIDGGPISIVSVAQPTNGTVVITNGGADLTYQPDPDFCNDGSPADDFTYSLNGGSTATVAVTVTCVNDPPVVTFPTAGVNFDPNVGPVNLDPAATLTDIDSTRFNRVETTLDIGGMCDPLDTLTVQDQGTGPGLVGFDGTTVTFEGTAISTSVQPWTCLDAGTGAQDAFIIQLDTNADRAATQALLRALQFATTSPDNTSRSADVVVADDGAATGSAGQIINIDEAPEATSPADNETNFDPAASVTVDFSENVDIAAGAFAFECDSTSVAFTASQALPATGVATIDLVPDASLTPGALCTVTVTAAAVVDSDTIDPPDSMTADAVFGFAVEAPPQVDALSPADGSTNVAPGADVVIGFDEPVDLDGNWFTLQCGTTTFSPGNGNVTVTSNDATNTQVTLNPNADFGFGDSCVLDIFASATDGVTDQDSVDGPGLDALDGNGDGAGGDAFSAGFDVEAAPEVTATSPAAMAVGIAGNTDIVIDFSEAVSAAAGAFALNCAGPIGLTASANAGQDQYTLTPNAGLPAGETCTVTVVASQISDVDTIDPPDNLDGNGDGTPGDDFNFSFTIDEAPALASVRAEVTDALTTVVDGVTLGGVDEDTTLVLGFSEPVNVTNAGVSLSCDSSGALATPTVLAVTGNGTDTITLTRTSGTFDGGETCTLGFDVTEVNDVDASDPPDNLEPVAGTFVFEIAPVVNGDARAVTAHLQAAYTDGAAGGNDDHLLVNDTCSGCTLTFGESVATANAAGSTATFSDGAIVTVSNDGTFTYNPPPGVTGGATDTFVYRLTTAAGGFDEATVTMTIDGPLIWFVDSSNATGTENGTRAFPFTDFGGASPSFDADAADAAGHAVFIDNGGAGYTCGVSLLDNQQVIGDGSFQTLQNLTGIAPVAETSPALPTPGFTAPVLSNAGGDCLTMAANNTLRGLEVGATAGYAIRDGGATVGTLSVAEVSIGGAGGTLSLVNGGTLNGSFGAIASTGHGNPGLELRSMNGNMSSSVGTINSAANVATMVLDGGSISMMLGNGLNKTAGNGAVVSVVNGHTGTVTISGAVSATSGSGLQFDNADGTYNLQGAVSVNGGTAGINVVNGSDGALNVTNAGSVIEGIQGIPFRVDNSTMRIDYEGDIDHRAPGADIGRRMIELIDATGIMTFNGQYVSGDNANNATAEALYLQATGAMNPVSFNYVDATTRDTSAVRGLTSGNIAIDRLRARCDGALTVGGDTHCLDFSDVTSNGMVVEALTADLNDAGENGGAISLVNTPGVWTVEDISGGLAARFESAIFGVNFGTLNIATVNSGSSPGGVATGTVSSDLASAIDLENGTLSALVGNLRSFNTATGLRLVNTSGPGLEALDGQIPNTTGDSVVLTNTGNIVLNSMEISGSDANGIRGQNVTNFTLSNSVVTNNGDAVNEGALRFDNLLGAVTISNTTISGSAEHNIEITNTSGVLNPLTITGSTIATTSPTLGADGLLLETQGSASATVNVSASTFDDNQTEGIQISALDNSSATLTVNDSMFTSTLDASPAGSTGARGIVLGAATSASLNFDIGSTTSNVFENFSPGIGEEAINVTLLSTSTASALMSGRINNNTFTNSGGAIGIDVRGDGSLVMEIDSNTANTSRQAIDVITGDGVADIATADLTITNNLLTVAGTAANPNNEAIGWLGDFDTVSCLNVRNNGATASGTRPDFLIDDFTTAGGSVDIESGPTDCGGAACASSAEHLETNNTITDAISNAGLVPVGTCVTVP